MKFYYTPERDRIIAEHEDKMFAKYSQIIMGYAPAFAKDNCALNVRRVWIPVQRTPFAGVESDRRLPFYDGYACYICCNVERNGKIVRYDPRDGEADYYDLSMSWKVSSISQFYRLKVTLLENAEDVVETMDHFVKIISSSSVELLT